MNQEPVPNVSQMKANTFTLLVAVALAGCTSPGDGRTCSLQSYLPGIQEFLQGYVDAESTNKLDFFYIAPVRKERGKAHTYAYWMTGNSIFVLDLPIGKMEDYFWYWYKARVDLTTDVVPTGEDIGGSTYLVDAPWAENIIRDSLKSGVKFVIQKKEANPKGGANGRRVSVLSGQDPARYGYLSEVCHVEFSARTQAGEMKSSLAICSLDSERGSDVALYVVITYAREYPPIIDRILKGGHSPIIERRRNEIVILYSRGANTTCVTKYSLGSGTAEYKSTETIAWNDGGIYRTSADFNQYTNLLSKRK